MGIVLSCSPNSTVWCNSTRDYRMMDCLMERLCRPDWIGNGLCNSQCQFAICDFDGGDCASGTAFDISDLGSGGRRRLLATFGSHRQLSGAIDGVTSVGSREDIFNMHLAVGGSRQRETTSEFALTLEMEVSQAKPFRCALARPRSSIAIGTSALPPAAGTRRCTTRASCCSRTTLH